MKNNFLAGLLLAIVSTANTYGKCYEILTDDTQTETVAILLPRNEYIIVFDRATGQFLYFAIQNNLLIEWLIPTCKSRQVVLPINNFGAATINLDGKKFNLIEITATTLSRNKQLPRPGTHFQSNILYHILSRFSCIKIQRFMLIPTSAPTHFQPTAIIEQEYEPLNSSSNLSSDE